MFRREYLELRIKNHQSELQDMGAEFEKIKAQNELEKKKLLAEMGLQAMFDNMDRELDRWKVTNQKKADNISGRIFELKELLTVLIEFEEQHAEELAELEEQKDANEFYVKDTDQ